ncbi:hypothetical protein D3C78_1759900 [compost metagenome]
MELEPLADQPAQIDQHFREIAPGFTLYEHCHDEVAQVCERHALAQVGQGLGQCSTVVDLVVHQPQFAGNGLGQLLSRHLQA